MSTNITYNVKLYIKTKSRNKQTKPLNKFTNEMNKQK